MELLPGDVGFATIGGRLGTMVSVGQAIIGDGCRFTHAWIYVGDGDVLEAMPEGARVRPYAPGHGPVYRLPLGGLIETEHLIGTPYSFADYLALALHHRAPRARITAWVRRYVTDSGHMICSQLVDHMLCRAGYHVFDDGRLPQDVTPGDLYYACAEQGVRVVR